GARPLRRASAGGEPPTARPGRPDPTTSAVEHEPYRRARPAHRSCSSETLRPTNPCRTRATARPPWLPWGDGPHEGGSGDRLVVVSHQADKDECSVMFLARRLVDDGYLVAVPVHRGGDTALVQPAHDIAAAAGTEPVVTPGGGHAFDVLAVDGVLPQLLDFIAEPR